MYHTPQATPMRQGFIFSLLLHGAMLVFLMVQFPELFPEPEVKAITVRLVTEKAPDEPKPQPKQPPTPPQPVRTQSSAAPKEAPKPQPKPEPVKQEPKAEVQAITPPESKPEAPKITKPEPVPAKPEPKPEPKPAPVIEESRPEKLDKTPDKEAVISSVDDEAKVVQNPDDFLAALDFIKNLEEENTAKAEVAAKPVVADAPVGQLTVAEMAEVAIIKQHIERHWYRPPGLLNSDQLRARVEVVLNRDGTIQSLRLLEGSGQPFYDKSLLRAVRKAVPLPIPTEKYEKFKLLDLYFAG